MLGIFTLFYLDDKPEQARWLTEAEKRAVMTDLRNDVSRASARKHKFLDAVKTPQIWLLALIYFLPL